MPRFQKGDAGGGIAVDDGDGGRPLSCGGPYEWFSDRKQLKGKTPRRMISVFFICLSVILYIKNS